MSTALKRYDESDGWSLAEQWHERYPTYLKVNIGEGDITREEMSWEPGRAIRRADIVRAERRLRGDFVRQHLTLAHALRITRIAGASEGLIDLSFTLLGVKVDVYSEPRTTFDGDALSHWIWIEWDFRLTGPTPVLQEIKAHFFFGHGPFGCGVWADQS